MLLEKAEQCRRLADSIKTQSDPAIAVLLSMADELEARAVAQGFEEARLIFLGIPAALIH